MDFEHLLDLQWYDLHQDQDDTKGGEAMERDQLSRAYIPQTHCICIHIRGRGLRDYVRIYPEMQPVDNPYLCIVLGCEHIIEQHNEASFSTILMDLLCLQVAQMPRSPDLAIFVQRTSR